MALWQTLALFPPSGGQGMSVHVTSDRRTIPSGDQVTKVSDVQGISTACRYYPVDIDSHSPYTSRRQVNIIRFQ
jgi:hypothetical protein